MKKEIRMPHEILVHRPVRPIKKAQGLLFAAAAAAGLLPGAGDAAGVAGQNRGIQVADVDAQFQRIGGHHA